MDGTRVLDLQLNRVKVGSDSLIGPIGKAMPLIMEIIDRAVAALCAEAVGVMDRTHQMTLDYLKTTKME